MKKLLLLLALTGCTHSIHEVHVSDFEPGVGQSHGKMVQARTEQFVILGFAGDTDYVTQAYNRLQDACKGGRIQGITTQYSTSHSFFSWTNKVLMQGLCLKK